MSDKITKSDICPERKLLRSASVPQCERAGCFNNPDPAAASTSRLTRQYAGPRWEPLF